MDQGLPPIASFSLAALQYPDLIRPFLDLPANSRDFTKSSFPPASKSLALRYWNWGNVPEKTRNEFHAKDATIAKRDSTSLSFSRFAFQELA
jgi:hypothetical protein